jgi:hypothetical protein
VPWLWLVLALLAALDFHVNLVDSVNDIETLVDSIASR